MTTQALTVDFNGTNLFVVEHNGQPYTPMKQIVEGMGLDWSSQLAKLNSNKKRWGMVKIAIPTANNIQEAVCMPLRKLAGWLSTIYPNKVKPELKETIIKYQNECDDVLWDHWQQKHQFAIQQAPEPKTKIAHKGGLSLEMQDEIKALIKGRVEVELPKEKWGAGSMRMWAAIKGKFNLSKEQSYKDLSPEHFASCISLLARLDLGDLTLPKPSKMENLINLTLDINACVQRLLVTANNGQATISQVPPDAYILTREQIKNNMHDVLPGYRLVEANLYHALEGLQTELMKQAALPSPDNQ